MGRPLTTIVLVVVILYAVRLWRMGKMLVPPKGSQR